MLVAGLLLVAAVVLGRVDLVVLAAPFALGTALALRRRPVAGPVVVVDLGDQFIAEGGTFETTISAGNRDVVAYDLVFVEPSFGPWLSVRHGDQPYAAAVPRGGIVDIDFEGEALRWGRHPVGPTLAHAVACDGLLRSTPVAVPIQGLKIYPVTEPFTAADAVPRAAGLVGGHRSRLLGEGYELAGVRMFSPGDRLRRVDWRVTLRSRQLHVAATLSDRDAEVVILLDVLSEAGQSGGVRGAASVLDTTVRAGAAIAEHYLQQGDRVSLLEYGNRARRLRAASGRRQYVTVLEWLLDVQAAIGGNAPGDHLFAPHIVSSNALLVVLTPLIDQRSAGMLARMTRAGRFVIAVDTLPTDLPVPERGAWAEVAFGLWRMEREHALGALREYGVPVVAWAGTGSLDEVLRDVSRLAAAPRPVAR